MSRALLFCTTKAELDAAALLGFRRVPEDASFAELCAGKLPLAAVSLRSTATGLNLAANTVVMFSKTCPERGPYREQAQARVFRANMKQGT